MTYGKPTTVPSRLLKLLVSHLVAARKISTSRIQLTNQNATEAWLAGTSAMLSTRESLDDIPLYGIGAILGQLANTSRRLLCTAQATAGK